MTVQIYRTKALRRFSSPERTDRLLQIVGPKSWIGMLALLWAIGSALAWSVFGRVPIKVIGSGIIQFYAGGTRAVVSQDTGILSEILVTPGNSVREGEVIARLTMNSVQQQIESARNTLKTYQDNDRRLVDFYKKYVADKSRIFAHQREEYAKLLSNAEETIRSGQAILDGYVELQQKGFATATQVQSARQTLMSNIQSREQIKVNALQVDTDEQALVNQRERDLEANREKIVQAQNQLRDLEERLRLGTDICAPVSGKLIQFEAQLHTIVNAGTTVSLIEFGERRAAAIIYVPTLQGKQVVTGMRVNVSPTTVKSEQYGDIIGTVRAVGAYPATPADMMRVLNNQTLVTSFAAAGAPLEVLVQLQEDPTTSSGLAWTSAAGPPLTITSGTIAEGRITLEDNPPITLVIPFLKKFFGL